MDPVEVLKKYFSSEDVEALKKISLPNRSELKPGQEWKGCVFPPGSDPSVAKYAYENWTPKEGDVFVVSFPKTGSNLTMELVRQILHQDEESDEISKALPFSVKMFTLKPCEKFALLDRLSLKRRQFLSHLPPYLLNLEKIKKSNAKIVYVLRNPKDMLVSFYNFLIKLPGMSQVEPVKSMIGSGFNEFVNYVSEGQYPVCMKPGEWYPDHIFSWYKHRDGKNVYFIYYENMMKDLQQETKRLAEFLEAPMTDETAKKIAAACTFDNMKKELAQRESNLALFSSLNMRKGGVGGWKDYFTVNQSERIDAIMKEKLKETDIRFTYEL